MELKTINIATIGTSCITEQFISVIKSLNQFSLAAVFSRDMEKAKTFAQKHHAEKFYDQLEDMASDSAIDAVYIASPNFLHYAQVMMFLKAGKHVLCEKPMASNEREAEEMIRTSREKNLVLLEAIRPMYDPGLHIVRENLFKLGKIRRVSFQYGKYSSKYDAFLEGKEPNIFSPACSAGALMDMGVYCVNPLIYLFGFPHKIQADCVKLRNGIDGAGTVLMNYGDMTADISYSKISDSRLHSEIQGEEGTMLVSSIAIPRKAVICYRNGDEEKLSIPDCENNMIFEAEVFARAIAGQMDITEYQEKTLESMRLMDQIRKQEGIVFPAD